MAVSSASDRDPLERLVLRRPVRRPILVVGDSERAGGLFVPDGTPAPQPAAPVRRSVLLRVLRGVKPRGLSGA
jgi:hypothetical protein